MGKNTASGAKTTKGRGSRGGRGGRGVTRGRGSRGRSGAYGGAGTSPGEQAAVDKAAAKYKKVKSSMSKREQAKDLLEILIPQTVEINLQQMLASGQLKKKNVSKKRREMLKQQMRAAKMQTSKGKRKKKKKTKKRKKKSSRYYSTSDSDSDSETSSDTSSDDSSDSDSSESSASSSISTSSSSSDAATSRKRRKRKKDAQRKKKKKEKEKAAADAAQTDRDAETAGKLLSQEQAMEAKYAARAAKADLEYKTLLASVTSLQDTVQLQVDAAAASGTTVPAELARRISFSAAGVLPARSASAPDIQGDDNPRGLRTQTVGQKTQSRTLMSELDTKFALLKKVEQQVLKQSASLRKREIQTQAILRRVQRTSAKMVAGAKQFHASGDDDNNDSGEQSDSPGRPVVHNLGRSFQQSVSSASSEESDGDDSEGNNADPLSDDDDSDDSSSSSAPTEGELVDNQSRPYCAWPDATLVSYNQFMAGNALAGSMEYKLDSNLEVFTPAAEVERLKLLLHPDATGGAKRQRDGTVKAKKKKAQPRSSPVRVVESPITSQPVAARRAGLRPKSSSAAAATAAAGEASAGGM